jgi:hypothetical protein
LPTATFSKPAVSPAALPAAVFLNTQSWVQQLLHNNGFSNVVATTSPHFSLLCLVRTCLYENKFMKGGVRHVFPNFFLFFGFFFCFCVGKKALIFFFKETKK